VKKTHGLMCQDKIWFLFDGEDLVWETVKVNAAEKSI